MTKTAVIFVDTEQMLDGSPVAATEISSVPILKRNLLDLSRAAFSRIFVVTDGSDDRIKAVLDDSSKVKFEAYTIDNPTWKTLLRQGADRHALVLTSDVLFDYKVFKSMMALPLEPFRTIVAVDSNDYGSDFKQPTDFAANDGRIVSHDDGEISEMAGAYVASIDSVIEAAETSSAYIASQLAGERDGIGYFNIGNGFSLRLSSKKDIALAERLILRYIWKQIDGVHSRLNKRMIMPFIRLILKTPLTPNMISLIGALISIVSAYYFAKGFYVATIIGAVLGLVSSLLDHVDGSVARLKSMESNFGTWFESVCDYIYYFSFGIGLAIGLYSTTGNVTYIVLGALAITGTVISVVTTSIRRREYRVASNFSAHIQNTVTEERGNWVGFIVRNTSFIVRRAAMPWYVLIFTLLNALPFILFMLALTTNLFWMVQLLITKRHRPVEELRRER